MPLNQIALVPYKTAKVQFSQIAVVAAALQRQVTRDFSPIWEIDATVDAFASLEDVPLGYWPILISDEIGTTQAAGFHQDRMGQPYSLVKSAGIWSLTASHECLEMLADPFGNRVVSGWRPSVPAAASEKETGGASGTKESIRVEYLVEVCDPCEGPPYGYLVNGVLVSDFYTPDYFDAKPRTGTRYDFQGHLSGPRTILPGGYLSWHDPQLGRWVQIQHFDRLGVKPKVIKQPPKSVSNIRAWIDQVTPRPQEARTVLMGNGPYTAMADVYGDGPWEAMLGDGIWTSMKGKSSETGRHFLQNFKGVVYRDVAEAQIRDAQAMAELAERHLSRKSLANGPRTPKSAKKSK
jgi:hypothetical protein